MIFKLKTVYVETDEDGNEEWAGFNVLDHKGDPVVEVQPEKNEPGFLKVKLGNFNCSRKEFKVFIDCLARAERTMSGDK
jgi:hypothetical protein